MDIETVADEIVLIATEYGLDVIGAIIILIIGNIISKQVPKVLQKVMDKRGIDPTVSQFLSNFARFAILAITLLLVLAQFGVQTASLIAVLGAAGLAIGLALQGTLSNVAGGVMLLIFRPMRVGNYVEAGGHGGTVKNITLFTTELATVDNIQVLIPNGQVWGSAIRNYSFHPTRRMDLVIGIAYEDDMVRVWCDNGNYFPLKFALTKAIKQTFDKEGISIPYPQRTVHMLTED